MTRILTLWMLCACVLTLPTFAAPGKSSGPHRGRSDNVSSLIREPSIQGDGTRLLLPEPAAGSIVGVVTTRDAVSRPLDLANVSLEGTTMGTVTGNGGYFSVLAVPAGTYSLKACIVGFVPQVIADARIEPNATTVVKFCLEKNQSLVQVGTIKGTIVDRETNKPLDFCNVLILDTTMGAMGKNGGQFTINLVPVATYQVKASFVGYDPMTISDVRVDANKATVLDFRLKKGVPCGVQTITVTPEAHKVDIKSGAISHVTWDKEILSLPVGKWTEGAALNTNVVVHGGELHVRGPCRSGELSVRIDGVPVDDPCYGRVRPTTADERPVPTQRPARPMSAARCQGRVTAMQSPLALPPEVERRLDACECGAASAPTSFIAAVEKNSEPIGEEAALPKVTRLWGCMPNPFNPMTTIRFELAAKGHVELQIYDVRGRRVRQLLSREMEAGPQAVVWDGKTDAGRVVPSAVYLLRMEAGNFQARSKLIAIR